MWWLWKKNKFRSLIVDSYGMVILTANYSDSYCYQHYKTWLCNIIAKYTINIWVLRDLLKNNLVFPSQGVWFMNLHESRQLYPLASADDDDDGGDSIENVVQGSVWPTSQCDQHATCLLFWFSFPKTHLTGQRFIWLQLSMDQMCFFSSRAQSFITMDINMTRYPAKQLFG